MIRLSCNARHALRLSQIVILLCCLIVCHLSSVRAQSPIVIDGSLVDWASVPVAYDSSGISGAPGQIDFGKLKITNDQQFLYLQIELGKEIILQESNSLQLYIDTDFNASTGTVVNGIGAELFWNFGNRSGTFRRNGQTTSITQNNITLRSGPTVSSTVFELALSRSAQVNGLSVFPSSTIRVLIRDGTNGDMLPVSGQTIPYTFWTGSIPVVPQSINKLDSNDLRVMTWNVLLDGLWNSTQAPRYGRSFAETKPDIICFQEINSYTAAQTASFVSAWHAAGNSINGWYTAKNTDCVTLSRYPILNSWSLTTGDIATLINTSQPLGKPVLLINAHLKCCSSESDNTQRQSQIDRILQFIRDAKTPGGLLTLTVDTPIIVVGDLNLVSHASQLNSLLNGQIFNQSLYGPSFAPDWDGAPLANLFSQHSDHRSGHTWFSSSSTYTAGKLDYQIYTDSVVDASNHYLLNTQTMSSQRLSSNGLQQNDSMASDHLAFVVDYRLDSPDPAVVLNSYVYHSGWSGNPSSGQWDAIDPVKVVAREGAGPTSLGLQNLISTSHGINGLVFDIQGTWNAAGLNASDFVFQVSPTGSFDPVLNPPAFWPLAPSPNHLSVSGSSPHRVLIKWSNNAIANRWLRVTVLANQDTGLAEPVSFYVGHLLGETTGPDGSLFTVLVADLLNIRAQLTNSVNPGSSVDIDKNGLVLVGDILAMRPNLTAQLPVIVIP